MLIIIIIPLILLPTLNFLILLPTLILLLNFLLILVFFPKV